MFPRLLRVKFEKWLSFDGWARYIFWRIVEGISGGKSTYDVGQLAEWLESPIEVLEKWIWGMPNGYRYESFKVPKKRGRGLRIINSPNHELKSLQRLIYHKLLKRLNIHNAATGFVRGKSIVDNARPHVKQGVVVNIDLKDFFSNISSNRVYRFWRFLGWDVKAATILTNICCYENHLPQGAPTSPALSNLCNILLDSRLDGVVKREMGQYTRYADDITFSFPAFDDRHRLILKKVSQILASEDYEIQKKKRVRIQRPHQRQTSTGLVVNQEVNLPREVRKRIRAMENHLSKNTLSEKDLHRLKGYRGLLSMVKKNNITAARNEQQVDGDRNTRTSILFLAADPSDASRLRLGQEFREIAEQLQLAKLRDRFILEQPQLSLRARDISRALLEKKPSIVHFSGHGSADGSICFEDEVGQAHFVSIEALAALFEQFSMNVNCVILNACYSEAQADAIAENIKYVVGMKKAIGDQAAIAFAIGFYQALGAGSTIEDAYKLGCVQISLQGISESLTPTLVKKNK